MRYLIQFVVPVAIFAAVVYLAMRVRKRRAETEDDPRGMFVLILIIGGALAATSLYLLRDYFGF